MIALFALLILIAGVGLVAAWLGSNPGSVSMVWFGYQVETSISVLLLLVVLGALFFTFIYNLLRKIFLAPNHYMERRSIKQYRLALTEITHSVAALAAADMSTAEKHTRKSEKALGTTPLTLLLRAQISKSEGSDGETRALLEKLLEYPETEYLAAKSLSDAARKQQFLPQALTLAQRAHRINPKERHGAWAVFDLHLNAHKFQEALAQAQQARKTRAFSRADMVTAKGKIALKQAEMLHAEGNSERALPLAAQAVKQLPGDVEAATLCAHLYAKAGQSGKAMHILQAQWKIQPSTALANLFEEITAGMKPAKKERLLEKLVASNEAAAENVLLKQNARNYN